jgi:signal transduction histidine kinase
MSKILYVDDDADNLVVFEALCADHFEVCTASSGAQALEILAKEEIAVLLADQRMPGMTGVELAEHASKEHPEVVRILVTAFGDLSEAIDAINRGQIRGYLRKPWDAEEVLAILRESLSTYATRTRARDLELHMMATERVYTLGVVTAGIAHELKGPLSMLAEGCNMLQARLESVREHVSSGNAQEALRLLASVDPFLASQHASTAAMIDTCRGFEVSNYEQDPGEHCNLEEVANTACRIALASRREESRLDLDLQAVPDVVGNPHRLGRVIINLLVNAFDALQGRSEGVILLKLFSEDSAVVLEVHDNGPGIDAKTMSRIFELFFSTKNDGGTGLGLAMSKSIVEELGGTLDCDSNGGGTVFRMRLASRE